MMAEQQQPKQALNAALLAAQSSNSGGNPMLGRQAQLSQPFTSATSTRPAASSSAGPSLQLGPSQSVASSMGSSSLQQQLGLQSQQQQQATLARLAALHQQQQRQQQQQSQQMARQQPQHSNGGAALAASSLATLTATQPASNSAHSQATATATSSAAAAARQAQALAASNPGLLLQQVTKRIAMTHVHLQQLKQNIAVLVQQQASDPTKQRQAQILHQHYRAKQAELSKLMGLSTSLQQRQRAMATAGNGSGASQPPTTAAASQAIASLTGLPSSQSTAHTPQQLLAAFAQQHQGQGLARQPASSFPSQSHVSRPNLQLGGAPSQTPSLFSQQKQTAPAVTGDGPRLTLGKPAVTNEEQMQRQNLEMIQQQQRKRMQELASKPNSKTSAAKRPSTASSKGKGSRSSTPNPSRASSKTGKVKNNSNPAAQGALQSVKKALQSSTAKHRKLQEEITALKRQQVKPDDPRNKQLMLELKRVTQSMTALKKQYEELERTVGPKARDPPSKSGKQGKQSNGKGASPQSSTKQPAPGVTNVAKEIKDALQAAQTLQKKYIQGIPKPTLSVDQKPDETSRKRAANDRRYFEMKKRCKKAKLIDHSSIANVSDPFKSTRDCIQRLLSFHVFDSAMFGEEESATDEQEFDRICSALVQRSDALISRFRLGIVRRASKPKETEKDVLVERLFLEDQNKFIQGLKSQATLEFNAKADEYRKERDKEKREQAALAAELAATVQDDAMLDASSTGDQHLSLDDISQICGFDDL